VTGGQLVGHLRGSTADGQFLCPLDRQPVGRLHDARTYGGQIPSWLRPNGDADDQPGPKGRATLLLSQISEAPN
jgi:hypothetical protein